MMVLAAMAMAALGLVNPAPALAAPTPQIGASLPDKTAGNANAAITRLNGKGATESNRKPAQMFTYRNSPSYAAITISYRVKIRESVQRGGLDR